MDPETGKWVDLKGMGADPLRKDIFVHMDFMKNVYPETDLPALPNIINTRPTNSTFLNDALLKVIKLFNDSPVKTLME